MSGLLDLLNAIPASVQSTFVKENLGVLLEDRAYSRDLLWTLQVYMESNGQVREAAKRLYVHRNTLAYRLARLQALLGCDLRDFNVMTDLQLALYFHRNAQHHPGGDVNESTEKLPIIH
ncbi:PucR family transcriptional regulator [Sulfobacillus thermosulfidooxidans]|uniref:PucR family transcriptional regulator n=1 Tax=Sulfobacillus thermosulfidooxidans TaxID=28034 RepID=UPI000313DE7C|nr:helix-turn-helix domain-containing protein [Sulfobacillus thermosulfidooxidans]